MMGNLKNSNNELVQNVMMYLDNALTKEEESQFLKEIQTNPQYQAIFRQEKSFRELIKNRMQRRQVSPALIESIKTKISNSDSIKIPK